MFLFFFLAVLVSAQADDSGRYGNYSGTCSFRPTDPSKTQYISCIPNKARAFEFGDYFAFGGTLARTPHFTIRLLSANYETLFQLNIRPEQRKLVFSNGRDKQGEETYTYKVPRRNDADLLNGPDGITFHMDGDSFRDSPAETFTFRHRTANPATDYKYLMITESESTIFGGALYHSGRASTYIFDTIPITGNLWKY